MDRLWIALFALAALVAATTPAEATISVADSACYYWADDDEPFVDATIPAIAAPLTQLDVVDESISSVFSLGFDFPFYGTTYRDFVVSDNGWLSFDTTVSDPAPGPVTLPSTGAPPQMIAAFWGDLEPAPIVNAYFYRSSDLAAHFRFFATHKISGQSVTINMVLYRTGAIKVIYDSINEADVVGTGIQNDGSVGFGLTPIFRGVSAEGFVLDNDAILLYLPSPTLDCSSAETLNCGSPLATITPAVVDPNITAYQCANNEYLGRENLFVFENTAISNLTFEVSSVVPGPNLVDLDLFLFAEGRCDEVRCLAMDEDSGGGIDRPRIDAPFLLPGRYYLAVDGRTDADAGEFDLTATCDVTGETLPCGSPVALGNTAGPSLWQTYSCTGEILDGAEWAYEIPAFPAGGKLRATLANHPGGDLDLLLFAKDDLQPMACLAYADEDMLVFDPPPGDYILIVDGKAAAESSFELTVSCDTELDCSAPAPDLTCQQPTTGTTTGGAIQVDRYSCTPDSYEGPEVVHRFTQVADGPVAFVLDAPPDVEMLLVDAGCNEGRCLAAGSPLTLDMLPAGDYHLVIDGKNGAFGDYTITPICETLLEPDRLDVTLSEGECTSESKLAHFVPSVGEIDVLFSVDVSGGQDQALMRLMDNANNILDRLAALGADLRFGLTSFSDYDIPDQNICQTMPFGNLGDYPYRLGQAMTADRAQLNAAIAFLPILDGGDSPEAYSRALFEAYSDPALGWRPDARKVVILTADRLPHDCDPGACTGIPLDARGIDPGRDETAPGFDDLEIVTVMNDLGAQFIQPIVLLTPSGGLFPPDIGTFPTLRLIWECWADIAAGSVVDAVAGQLGTAGLDEVILAITDRSARCSELTLRGSTGYETWLANVSPPAHTDVAMPGSAAFDIDICVPTGTSGSHDFQVELVCDGTPIAAQDVHADISDCTYNPLANLAPGRNCAGDLRTLDAAGSTIDGCTGTVEYQWLEGATILTPFPALATQSVMPTVDTTYTLQIRCSLQGDCPGTGEIEIFVDVSNVIADGGGDATACENVPRQLGAQCDPSNTYLWSPSTFLDDVNRCDPTFLSPTIPVPPCQTYTVTVTDPTGCQATDQIEVCVTMGGGPVEFIGNQLMGVRDTTDVSLDWTTGATSARAYNVHRTAAKLDLDKAVPYAAMKLTEVSGTELWTDAGAISESAPFGPRLYYEVFSRECDGSSNVP